MPTRSKYKCARNLSFISSISSATTGIITLYQSYIQTSQQDNNVSIDKQQHNEFFSNRSPLSEGTTSIHLNKGDINFDISIALFLISLILLIVASMLFYFDKIPSTDTTTSPRDIEMHFISNHTENSHNNAPIRSLHM